jgi:hypothetical protein
MPKSPAASAPGSPIPGSAIRSEPSSPQNFGSDSYRTPQKQIVTATPHTPKTPLQVLAQKTENPFIATLNDICDELFRLVQQNTHDTTPVKHLPGTPQLQRKERAFFFPKSGGKGVGFLQRINEFTVNITELFNEQGLKPGRNFYEAFGYLIDMLNVGDSMNRLDQQTPKNENYKVPSKVYKLIFSCLNMLLNKLASDENEESTDHIDVEWTNNAKLAKQYFAQWVSKQLDDPSRYSLCRDEIANLLVRARSLPKQNNDVINSTLIAPGDFSACMIQWLHDACVTAARQSLSMCKIKNDWLRNATFVIDHEGNIARFDQTTLQPLVQDNARSRELTKQMIQQFFLKMNVLGYLHNHFETIIQFVTQHCFLGLSAHWMALYSIANENSDIILFDQEQTSIILDFQPNNILRLTTVVFIRHNMDCQANTKKFIVPLPLIISCDINLMYPVFTDAIESVHCGLLGNYAALNDAFTNIDLTGKNPHDYVNQPLLNKIKSIWPMKPM